MHGVHTLRPLALLNVPAAQSVHSTALALENDPTGHGRHLIESIQFEKDPAIHNVHEREGPTKEPE